MSVVALSGGNFGRGKVQCSLAYSKNLNSNININNNIKSLTLAIPITPQYHLILQYLGININIWFNNNIIKCVLGVNFTHYNA